MFINDKKIRTFEIETIGSNISPNFAILCTANSRAFGRTSHNAIELDLACQRGTLDWGLSDH
jgi:hypothetical protein